jgi:hypothetical protein
VIVGPSINKYDPEYLEAFLLYARDQDVVPDILSWHEIIEQHRPVIIPRHVTSMRAFMKENRITIRGIDINEFGSPERQTSPGLTAMYLANLDLPGLLDGTGRKDVQWGTSDAGRPAHAGAKAAIDVVGFQGLWRYPRDTGQGRPGPRDGRRGGCGQQ